MRNAVVTGASSGIGSATALHLAENGFRVFAGMRNLAKSQPLLEAARGLPLEVVQLDVTEGESIAEAFAGVTRHGPVDTLVNNAGIGGAVPFEFTTEDENRLMFETNYFGPVRCIQAVLPSMRERRSGCIVNVTSISGLFPWPNQICYAASKWALESVGAGLAHEVARFGIRVVNVEPGAVQTEIFENSKSRTRYDKSSPYQSVMRRNGKLIMAGLKSATTPTQVAEVILRAITADEYRLNWPAGEDAQRLAAGRQRVSMEEWVALGNDTSDEDYHRWYRQNFGMEL